jgi:hypothetical protein
MGIVFTSWPPAAIWRKKSRTLALKASGASRFDRCPACGKDDQVGAWHLLVRQPGGVQGRVLLAYQHERWHRQR